MVCINLNVWIRSVSYTHLLSIKVVSSVEEPIAHVNKYNTKHSEAIITNNYEHAQKFLDEVDAAAVYVNASTDVYKRQKQYRRNPRFSG